MTQTDKAINAIVEQAADWQVRLSDESEDRTVLIQQYEQWKLADPRHAIAAGRMEGFFHRLSALDELGEDKTDLVNASFSAARAATEKSRKPAVWPLLVLMLALLPAWLMWQTYPPSYLLADLNTAGGEWQQYALADGSAITLSSDSAVDLAFDPEQRRVELISGEIWVQVAKDAHRPFIIETRHGEIEALGTRFMVRDEADFTRLTMLESSVEVRNTEGNLVVNAGEQLVFDQYSHSALTQIDPAAIEQAWHSRMLMVDGMTLADVLRELDRYRPGKLFFNGAGMDAIRVSALLPLHDTDKALALLQARYPQLQKTQLSPYLTYISVQDGN